LILHVRDVSHRDSEAQAIDVHNVLRQLGITPQDGARVIDIWNKIDLLDEHERARCRNLAERRGAEQAPVLVSALTGEGLDQLAAEIERRLAQRRTTLRLVLDAADGAGLSWLYRHTEVIAKALREDGSVALTVRAHPGDVEKARARFGDAVALSSR
jgi:GTP-binding protein HflX